MAISDKHIATHRLNKEPSWAPPPLLYPGSFALEIFVDFHNWPLGHLFFFLFLGFKFPRLSFKFTNKKWAPQTPILPHLTPIKADP